MSHNVIVLSMVVHSVVALPRVVQNADRNKKISAVVNQTGKVVTQTGKAVGQYSNFSHYCIINVRS